MNEKLICQIKEDIKSCDNQSSKIGSEALYNELIAKYTVLDSDFKNGLPSMGKAKFAGDEFDFRPELKAISSKLQIILLSEEKGQEESRNPQVIKLHKFIRKGEELKKQMGLDFSLQDIFDSDAFVLEYNQWMTEINIFTKRHLREYPLYNRIHPISYNRNKDIDTFNDMMGYLNVLAKDDEFWNEKAKIGEIPILVNKNNNQADIENKKEKTLSTKKVFIVHGHDKLAETEMALFIERIGLKPIILHEQPNSGKTIIGKIEANSDVQYAVILYTPCDIGRAKEEKIEDEKNRARQNVVFEHGYLIGKLGRDKVSALVKGDVETPGDISGVVYIPMDDNGAWQTQLIKEMLNIGLECDFSKLYS